MSTSEFVREFVIDTGLRLGVGESRRTVCPMCRAVHENSFMITRTHYHLFYKCWRASCGCRGSLWSISRGVTGAALQEGSTGRSQSRQFTYATAPLPPLVLSILEEKYNLTEYDFTSRGVKWSEELESLVFSCRDFEGSPTGIVTKRLFKKDGVNKSLLFWEDEPPKYYLGRKPGDGLAFSSGYHSLWVVEDCLSSIRLYKEGTYSVALLGTHLPESLAVELSKRFSRLVVCLDPDATVKAAAIAANYRLLFDTVKIVVPKKDPKDLSQTELEAMLRG